MNNGKHCTFNFDNQNIYKVISFYLGFKPVRNTDFCFHCLFLLSLFGTFAQSKIGLLL